jgi:hypothetical protein
LLTLEAAALEALLAFEPATLEALLTAALLAFNVAALLPVLLALFCNLLKVSSASRTQCALYSKERMQNDSFG